MEFKGYSRPTYSKLVHWAKMRSTVVRVIHKLTADEFVDNSCRPTICSVEIFEVQKVEIAHVTLATPT